MIVYESCFVWSTCHCSVLQCGMASAIPRPNPPSRLQEILKEQRLHHPSGWSCRLAQSNLIRNWRAETQSHDDPKSRPSKLRRCQRRIERNGGHVEGGIAFYLNASNLKRGGEKCDFDQDFLTRFHLLIFSHMLQTLHSVATAMVFHSIKNYGRLSSKWLTPARWSRITFFLRHTVLNSFIKQSK